jgi:excisionase family DNA binding protein
MTGAMSRAQLLALPPSVDLVTAGRALGIGRTKVYELARAGELPITVLHLGSSYRVVTADLLRLLGVSPDEAVQEDDAA